MRLQLGPLTLQNNLLAAPMAGHTDLAWRILAVEHGAGAVFSEMVSVEGLSRKKTKTLGYVTNDDSARPFALQLFGTNPDSFARSFEIIGSLTFDLIDINMGCPVKKVVARGAGAALMKDPKLVQKIVAATRGAYKGPLSIKIRSGWTEDRINAVEIAKIAEGEGANAIIVHGRTWKQGFTGVADWRVIADVKRALSVPVIGNGDVTDRESAEKMFKETGCDGVMIGRAALGRPWLFGSLGPNPEPGTEFILKIIRRHIEILSRLETREKYIVITMRKFLPKYLKGIPGAKALIQEVNFANTVSEVLNSLESFE